MRFRMSMLLTTLAAAFICQAALGQKPAYPAARVEKVVDQIHGVAVEDPYRWLEKSDDPAVGQWTEQQNALTRKYLDQFPRVRERLSATLSKLYSVPVSSPPDRYGESYFYSRREGDQNHAIVYLKREKLDAEAKAIINPNEWSKDGTVALDWMHVSPDGAMIAYGRSAGGNEKSTLYLRDVNAAADSALEIPNTRSCEVAWDGDGQGFHYTRYPAAGSVPAGDENYYRKVYYHKFGTDPNNDPAVFGDGLQKEAWTDCSSSSDFRYVLFSSSVDWSKNDLYFKRIGGKDKEPKAIAVGLEGRFSGDVHDKKIYLLTNFQAPRFRVLVTDVDKPEKDNWKEIVPQGKGVIQDMLIADGKLVLNWLEDASARVTVHELSGEKISDIALPTLGAVSDLHGRPGSGEMFFSFQSFAYPPTVFRYDFKEQKLVAVDENKYPVDLTGYETKQVWFKSKDGTSVPMFVTHKSGLKTDGKNPTVLYGYGGFNIASTPRFVQSVFPWLDAGGVYAVANIRGGGEFGEEWHQAGRLDKKQNVFDDMIAAGEKLVADGYCKPERLGALGGSNGGLLMGALLTQRPDLFRAIVCAVPLLDMLRYHQLSIARLWIPEYGSAENAEQFKYLNAYSPYQRVKNGTKYPATLFTTAENDSRVDPMHARKMAARLQAATSSDMPILLWVERKAGHGVGKPLAMRIADEVDRWVFFMWQLGVLKGDA